MVYHSPSQYSDCGDLGPETTEAYDGQFRMKESVLTLEVLLFTGLRGGLGRFDRGWDDVAKNLNQLLWKTLDSLRKVIMLLYILGWLQSIWGATLDGSSYCSTSKSALDIYRTNSLR